MVKTESSTASETSLSASEGQRSEPISRSSSGGGGSSSSNAGSSSGGGSDLSSAATLLLSTPPEGPHHSYRDFSHITEANVREITGDASVTEHLHRAEPQQQEEQPGSATASGDQRGGKESFFPSKLHQILADEALSDAISWMPHGRAWKILRKEELQQVGLPKYFRHKRFSSFLRQVNGWGFRRVTIVGPDEGAYYHEYFLRGLPHVSLLMTRKSIGKKPVASRTCTDMIMSVLPPDFYRITDRNPLPDVHGNWPSNASRPTSSSASAASMQESSPRRMQQENGFGTQGLNASNISSAPALSTAQAAETQSIRSDARTMASPSLIRQASAHPEAVTFLPQQPTTTQARAYSISGLPAPQHSLAPASPQFLVGGIAGQQPPPQDEAVATTAALLGAPVLSVILRAQQTPGILHLQPSHGIVGAAAPSVLHSTVAGLLNTSNIGNVTVPGAQQLNHILWHTNPALLRQQPTQLPQQVQLQQLLGTLIQPSQATITAGPQLQQHAGLIQLLAAAAGIGAAGVPTTAGVAAEGTGLPGASPAHPVLVSAPTNFAAPASANSVPTDPSTTATASALLAALQSTSSTMQLAEVQQRLQATQQQAMQQQATQQQALQVPSQQEVRDALITRLIGAIGSGGQGGLMPPQQQQQHPRSRTPD